MSAKQSLTMLLVVATAGGASACAAALPPQELLDARSAHQRASTGPAAKYDPAGLHTAETQLAEAETAFREDGDTPDTRDAAYLAVRKAELSESVGRARESERARKATVNEMHADETRAVANTAAELERTKSQLDAQGGVIDAQKTALEQEKARAAEAEERARRAAEDLARFATVKQEAKGMVITIAGNVLFASAKWELLPAAQARLAQVATALIEVDPVSSMVVEGHTDSQGGVAYNQDLSQRRAQTVRDYLVSRGIASDRISAQGFGASRSIADNNSPEGRANNRRVEIVIQKNEARAAVQ